jgi:hypothetical protein
VTTNRHALARLSLLALLVAACGATPPTASLTPAAPAEACPVAERSGELVSNRLVDIRIESSATADTITFVFGERAESPGRPTGSLRAVTPPFHQGGSGEVVTVPGRQFVEIKLEGMFLYDDNGATYTGEREFQPRLASLTALVNVDEFEGYSTWIAGYDGAGCVSLGPAAAPGAFVVSFGH